MGLDADTDWLPILIRIRDLAREPDNIDILDFARQFAEKRMSVKKLPEGFFEYWLEDGRALILLDGLDEVADPSKRSEMVQILCSLNETDFQEEVLQCLNDNKDRIDEYRLLNYRAALGEKEAVIKTWLELLKDQDSSVRSIAADALVKLGKKSCDVLPAVAQWIEQHQDSEYVGFGIDVLWDLVQGEE